MIACLPEERGVISPSHTMTPSALPGDGMKSPKKVKKSFQFSGNFDETFSQRLLTLAKCPREDQYRGDSPRIVLGFTADGSSHVLQQCQY